MNETDYKKALKKLDELDIKYDKKIKELNLVISVTWFLILLYMFFSMLPIFLAVR